MHHIIYLSHATKAMTDDELAALLTQARDDNARRGITGVLVYGNQQFMQIMEGEAATVAQLYEQVARDPRHERVVKLADKDIAQRSFADWSMAFQTLLPEEFEQLTGYTAPEQLYLQQPGLSAADALLLEMSRRFVLPAAQP